MVYNGEIIAEGKVNQKLKIIPIVFVLWGISFSFSSLTNIPEYKSLESNIAMLILGIIFLIAGIILLLYINSGQIVVMRDKVVGKAAFGKNVELPIDSISAVGLSSFFSGVAVGTSSGKVSFVGISNNVEIKNAISQLITNRQNMRSAPVPVPAPAPAPAPALAPAASDMDKLIELKQMLDAGLINQEEYDAKKKQILGI